MTIEGPSNGVRSPLEGARRAELTCRALADAAAAREALVRVEAALAELFGVAPSGSLVACGPTRQKPKGRFVYDPELRDFCTSRLPTMTYSEVVAAARAAFGPERTPSRSALQRLWKTKRGGFK
jgi:hypothetical protein